MPRKKKEDNPIPENPFLLRDEHLKISDTDKVGPTRKKRMDEKGIQYLQDLCCMGAQDLARVTGLDLSPCEKIVMKAKKELEGLGAIRKSDMSALDLYKYFKEIPTLKTNSFAVDLLFGGALKCETLTEVFGQFGSGKTQFIITMAVEAIQAGYKVLFVDCEDTFKPERLLSVAVGRGYYPNEEAALEMLDKIIIRRATNSTEVMDLLDHITPVMLENDIKVVAVDGAIGLVRNEYHGRGELSVRQDFLKPLMGRLSQMPLVFKCWVMITNQVQADPGQFFGDPIKPIGGNIVGHAPTYRVYFRKVSKTKWIASMIDSPEHANQDVPFQLGLKGIEDNPDELKKLKKNLERGDEPDSSNGVIPDMASEEGLKRTDLLLDYDKPAAEQSKDINNQ